MITRRLLLWLAGWAALAPMPLAVLIAVGRLLSALGDAAGAGIIDWIALAVGISWTIGLIGLLLALAGYALFPPDDEGEA